MATKGAAGANPSTPAGGASAKSNFTSTTAEPMSSAADADPYLKGRKYTDRTFKRIIPQWKQMIKGYYTGWAFFNALMIGPFIVGPVYVYYNYGSEWETWSDKLSRAVEGTRVSMWNRRNMNSKDSYYTQRPIDYKEYAGFSKYDIADREKNLDLPVWRTFPQYETHDD